MCPKVSTHPELSEGPEREAQVPALAPVRQQQALELARLRPEPAQAPELRQQVPPAAESEPERVRIWPLESSLPEIATAVLALDFPQLPPERVRLLASQALPSQPRAPGLRAAPPVVNKTQTREHRGPSQSELSEFVGSFFHLSK